MASRRPKCGIIGPVSFKGVGRRPVRNQQETDDNRIDLSNADLAFGEQRVLYEPDRPIARPLTSPLPAKGRGEGASAVAPQGPAAERAVLAPLWGTAACRPLSPPLCGERQGEGLRGLAATSAVAPPTHAGRSMWASAFVGTTRGRRFLPQGRPRAGDKLASRPAASGG